MVFDIALIYGSVRSERQGIKVAKYLEDMLKKRGHRVFFIDPLEHKLPLLDKMYKEFGKGKAPESMEMLAAMLKKADGFLIVSGEYNHSIPPALKNTLDHFQKEYFFKPSAIASYSAGSFGGVRAAVHLRPVLAELGMPSIPSVQPFPRVQENFDDQNKPKQEFINRITGRFLDEFEWYLQALKNQRELGTPY